MDLGINFSDFHNLTVVRKSTYKLGWINCCRGSDGKFTELQSVRPTQYVTKFELDDAVVRTVY